MSGEPQGEGVQFPLSEQGRPSTTALGRAVVAAAARALNATAADAIAAEKDWRRRYGAHIATLERHMLANGHLAESIASAGLDALHEGFRFVREGESMTPREALDRFDSTLWATATVHGEAPRAATLAIPYRGELLSGDALRRQIDRWVAEDIMEPSAAAVLHRVCDEPEWLDLRDLHLVLLGAGAEVGPMEMLLRLGANVVAVDLDRPEIWRRLLPVARRGAGTMSFPVSESVDANASDDQLAAAAGADLLTRMPEIRNWLAAMDVPLTVGAYAYLHGQHHLRVAMAMDAIMADLVARRPDVSLAFLLTPTDVYAIPREAEAAALTRYRDAGLRGLWRRPLGWLTGGRLYAPNADAEVPRDESHHGLRVFDGILPAQGPNYALAKRLQKWRALLARGAGVRVSANVAPSTATASVLTRPAFAAAFTGAGHYGVEVFEPATTNALMAAVLVHDLRCEGCASDPGTTLPHPLALFAESAIHGGMWRTGHRLRSVIEVAAVRGLLKGALAGRR